MNKSPIDHFNRQDLPESGPCPQCRDESIWIEIDPDTEEYIVDCPSCGKLSSDRDEIDDLL